MFRCDAKTARSTHADVSAGQPESSHEGHASLAVYPETASIFFVTAGSGTHRLSLFHCKTDGAECSHTFLSEDTGYGTQHSLIVDRANDRVIVVARQDDSAGARTSLFTLRPW